MFSGQLFFIFSDSERETEIPLIFYAVFIPNVIFRLVNVVIYVDITGYWGAYKLLISQLPVKTLLSFNSITGKRKKRCSEF